MPWTRSRSTGADVLASGHGPLVAGVPAVLHLDRHGRRVSVKVTPQSAYAVAALARLAPPGPAGGVSAGELLSSAVLSEAGLPPDALVQHIDGRRVTSAEQARRDLSRARRPLSIHLFHQGQWFFAGVENTR